MASDPAPTGTPASALDGVRVLDLADPAGVYCGKLLADLGADVIRVEPPGGDTSRTLPPFFAGEPGPENSLFHWHYNANKRGITLDLQGPEGRDLFLRLAATSHIVIETFKPGFLQNLGLGYDILHAAQPVLILVSITPFGQTGPYSEFLGSELINQASGGLLWMCGWPNRPPVMAGGGLAMHQVSGEAAAAALLALYSAEETGEGQHIDVSAQAAMPLTLMTGLYDFFSTGRQREGRIGNRITAPLNGMFACRDGWLDFRVRGRPGQWEQIVEWLESAGMAEDLAAEAWREHAFRAEAEHAAHINEIFQRFLMTLDRETAMDGGQRRGFEVGAVYSAEDLIQDRQLQARAFWTELEHPQLGQSFVYPGAPYTLSETPWRLERPAPLLGEHNESVYGELGLRQHELARLHETHVI
jgi:crotonobetainyl-CoA:carnitine CoA-transferase CaiB-like acyl-CoA transferase